MNSHLWAARKSILDAIDKSEEIGLGRPFKSGAAERLRKALSEVDFVIKHLEDYATMTNTDLESYE